MAVKVTFYCDADTCRVTATLSNPTITSIVMLPLGWSARRKDGEPVHYCPGHSR